MGQFTAMPADDWLLRYGDFGAASLAITKCRDDNVYHATLPPFAGALPPNAISAVSPRVCASSPISACSLLQHAARPNMLLLDYRA